jgi:HD-like signal output (HDOD) protein
LIQKANRTLAKGQKKIDSCSGAIALFGLKATRSSIISYTQKSVFTPKSNQIKEKMAALWTHSQYVASICSILATKTPGFDPDRALLAGLIHDIGMIPILVLADAASELQPVSCEDLDFIIKKLQNDIGSSIMRNWGFPRDFEDIAGHSEDWFLDFNKLPNYIDIVIIAQLHSYIDNHQFKNLPQLHQLPGYKKLAQGQLNAMTSLKIIEDAKQHMQQAFDFYSK